MSEKKKTKSLKITQRKSRIGRQARDRRVLDALGLRHREHSIIKPDTPVIRGMVAAVSHLVTMEEVKD